MKLAIVETDAAEPRSEIDRLRAAWEAVDAEFLKLVAKRDDMLLALNLASRPGHPDAVPELAARAERYLEKARRRPSSLLEDIEDVNHEIDVARPGRETALANWNLACEAETDRIALSLVPAHRDAVRRIARGLEQLSAALFDELEIRSELARMAPLKFSRHLPNMSTAFAICRLNEPRSTASEWARLAKSLGLLHE